MTNKHEALVRYRLQLANQSLESAQILLNENSSLNSVRSSYSAMLNTLLALVALRKHKISMYSSVLTMFHREFVKKGVFDDAFSSWFQEAFYLRHQAESLTEATFPEARAKAVLKHAQMFVEGLRKEIGSQLTQPK